MYPDFKLHVLFPILPDAAQLSRLLVPTTALLPMASAKREIALITALVVGGATLASFLLCAPMKPLLRAQAAILIKGMLVDANTVIGRGHHEKKWDAIVPLDEMLARLQTFPSDKKHKLFKSWTVRFVHVATRIFNYQSQSRVGMVGAYHYNLGNDFFKLWLDKHYIQYSCGYFKGVKNHLDFESAQENKLRVIAEKLKLEAGMRVLDIGCGWGGLACYLAKNYGVHVTSVTISNEQLSGARERAAKQGISHLTKFEYRDYREMDEEYDRVVSIAMIEAVDYKNLDDCFTVVARCLKDNRDAIVHGTASNRSLKVPIELWMLQYIFPTGFVPSIAQTLEFAERKLVVEDVHNFGPDYEKTMFCWHHHF